jgi:hypothetical protein
MWNEETLKSNLHSMPCFGIHRKFCQHPTKIKSNVQNASKSSFNDFQYGEHLPKDFKDKNQGI